jgi:hypothetical protein
MNTDGSRVRTRLFPTIVGPLEISPAEPLETLYTHDGSVMEGVVADDSGIVTSRFGPHCALAVP